jgi:hypothetical protein
MATMKNYEDWKVRAWRLAGIQNETEYWYKMFKGQQGTKKMV